MGAAGTDIFGCSGPDGSMILVILWIFTQDRSVWDHHTMYNKRDFLVGPNGCRMHRDFWCGGPDGSMILVTWIFIQDRSGCDHHTMYNKCDFLVCPDV